MPRTDCECYFVSSRLDVLHTTKVKAELILKYRMRPCAHSLCRTCYESMTVEERVIKEVPTLCSACPIPGCGQDVDRAVAWPYSSEAINEQQLYSSLQIRARNIDKDRVRTFRSAASPAKEAGYRRPWRY